MSAPKINFFNEDITFLLPKKRQIRNWLFGLIVTEGYELGELNLVFCSDAHLLEMNQKYLNHDTLTDVITFDNSEVDKQITGDIFISVDRVRENAADLNFKLFDELLRVIVHGTLHLLGYTDKSDETKKIMTAKEDEYITLFM